MTELASPSTPTGIAKLRAQDRTSCTNAVISRQLRWGLITPPSYSRNGTAMAIAIHTRRPTSFTHSSSA